MDTPFQTPASNHGFPWWPAPEAAYHAATQLANGRLSMIVDPGAWTNLIGADLARRLTQSALRHGIRPKQVKMDQPMTIQGVGNGTQACRYKMEIPIAVPHTDGGSHQHTLTVPIVEGTGSELPGLLGLRSLESARAILDMGTQRLIFPGQGPLTMELPPGTVEIPLQKAPSGHLVMVIDDYEKLIKQSGGVEETGLQLHTAETVQDQNQSSSSSSAAHVESTSISTTQGGEARGSSSGEGPRLPEQPSSSSRVGSTISESEARTKGVSVEGGLKASPE